MATIGFVGLGNMGLPMAGNLVKAGHSVSAFDIVGANVEAATKDGVSAAANANAVADGADVVVTMLPAGKHVLGVYGDGLLAAAKPGTLFIDSSTIDVADARAAHDMAKEAGIQGRVFVTFVVMETGKIANVKLLRGIGGGCDEEAIRVVKGMPSWKPGKQRGKPVRVQYNLPIKFTLQ